MTTSRDQHSRRDSTLRRDPTLRRAKRAFWLLVAIAVVATGGLSRALAADPGFAAAAGVAVSGLTLAVVAALALRILACLSRP